MRSFISLVGAGIVAGGAAIELVAQDWIPGLLLAASYFCFALSISAALKESE